MTACGGSVPVFASGDLSTADADNREDSTNDDGEDAEYPDDLDGGDEADNEQDNSEHDTSPLTLR